MRFLDMCTVDLSLCLVHQGEMLNLIGKGCINPLPMGLNMVCRRNGLDEFSMNVLSNENYDRWFFLSSSRNGRGKKGFHTLCNDKPPRGGVFAPNTRFQWWLQLKTRELFFSYASPMLCIQKKIDCRSMVNCNPSLQHHKVFCFSLLNKISLPCLVQQWSI